MLPPLVQRELRVALLRRGARLEWITSAWVTAAITLVVLLALGLGSLASSGRALFLWLFSLATFRIVRRGFGLTADLFSEERRNGTLGLVVLTGLSPLEIFIHKLLGAVLLVAYGLLGGLPFFAIPFLAGGVLPTQFIWGFVFLANALLFCVAIGLLASVMHRDGGQAHLTAYALAAVLCLVIPCVHWVGAVSVTVGTNRFSYDWLVLSPAYPAYLVFASFGGRGIKDFWLSSGFTLGYSVSAMLLAAIILQRTWRESEGVLNEVAWSRRWRRWLRSGGAWRWGWRKKLLEEHPYSWLAARDQTHVLLAYSVLVVFAIGWLVGWSRLGSQWSTPAKAFICSIILHMVLNLIFAYAAAQPFAEERISGGFEALLTSPIRAAEMVEGQFRGLLIQFRSVAGFALCFDVLCFSTGLAWLPATAAGLVCYVFAWSQLMALFVGAHLNSAARAMWIASWTGRRSYSALKGGGRFWWVLIWAWFCTRQFRSSTVQEDPAVLVFGALLTFPALVILANGRALRRKLTRELRFIACAPIPSRSDKRFKHWSPERIYPPGRWGELILKPGRIRHSGRRRRGRMDALNG